LFKKLQVLGHVPEGTVHGGAGGFAGFNINDPGAVFTSFGGELVANNAASSPIWGMLDAAATGQGGYTDPNFNFWPAMPTDTTTAAWHEFQVDFSNKLVDAVATWADNGHLNDIPTGVIGAEPGPIKGPPDSGVSPFVCSFAGDTGNRPGVPSDYWDTSLIFLVSPTNGSIVTPSQLSAGNEYYLAAVVGNRGQADGGKYSNTNGNGTAVQAKGIVMVWNTTFSPGVELPSLSNLSVSATNSQYDQYLLRSGAYDVVGFRLNVQTVFDGIIAALNSAVTNNQIDLGGKSAHDWVIAQGAHLCAKVVVRQGTDSYPLVGAVPDSDARIAQKNLAPFDVSITDTGAPNIIWQTFVSGQPFMLRLGDGEGRNTLILQAELPREQFHIYMAIPQRTFQRFFAGNGGGEIKGFRTIPRDELCCGKLADLGLPFPQAVVLEYLGGGNAIEFPALGAEEFVGMAVGIEYVPKYLKPGELGKVRLIHRALLPQRIPGTLCFQLEDVIAGGFTLVLRGKDPRRPVMPNKK
jgi:hypothetical protein